MKHLKIWFQILLVHLGCIFNLLLCNHEAQNLKKKVKACNYIIQRDGTLIKEIHIVMCDKTANAGSLKGK